uniref:Uncharacterized protein n=1 Tax=Opuntia streptacantha TaxID=393608 RepID=A0A7C9D5V2_OPUST
MRKGAYILIFLVWAFITIVTPTLVQWSAAAAQGETSSHITNDDNSEGPIKARRMLVLLHGIKWRKAPPPIAPLPSPTPPKTILCPPAFSPMQRFIEGETLATGGGRNVSNWRR